MSMCFYMYAQLCFGDFILNMKLKGTIEEKKK